MGRDKLGPPKQIIKCTYKVDEKYYKLQKKHLISREGGRGCEVEALRIASQDRQHLLEP